MAAALLSSPFSTSPPASPNTSVDLLPDLGLLDFSPLNTPTREMSSSLLPDLRPPPALQLVPSPSDAATATTPVEGSPAASDVTARPRSPAGLYGDSPRRTPSVGAAREPLQRTFSATPPPSIRKMAALVPPPYELSRPRRPSSLRNVIVPPSSEDGESTAPSSLASSRQTEESSADELSESSDTGSMVFGGTLSDRGAGSIVERGPPGSVRGTPESQLQAALRAMKSGGPSAGLGAQEEPEGTPHASDRLGGLMSLFEPPSRPFVSPLPPSTISAPSTPSFYFTPKQKSSSSESSSDPDLTPLAVRPPPLATARGVTPSPPGMFAATAPRPRDRFMRSQQAEWTQPVQQQQVEEEEEYHQQLAGSGSGSSSASSGRSQRSNLSDPALSTPLPGSSAHYMHSVSSHGEYAHEPPCPQTPSRSAGPSEEQLTASAGLFRFRYDTFTRSHLAALVDEFDDNGQEIDEEEAGRESKRIRLSPPERVVARPRRSTLTSDRGGRERSARRASPHERSLGGRQSSPFTAPRAREGFSQEPSFSPTRSRRRMLEEATEVSIDTEEERRARTRDRVEERKAIMEKIRVRQEEKERQLGISAPEHQPPSSAAPFEQTATVSASPWDEEEESEAGSIPRRHRLSPQKVSGHRRSRESYASPATAMDVASAAERKAQILATIESYPSATSASSSSGSGSSEDRPPLPHLAAAASASLRSALGSPSRSGSTSSLPGAGDSGSKRRFATTPLSRGRVSGLFGQASSTSIAGEESTTLKLDEERTVTVAMKPGHARGASYTTIGPLDLDAVLASAGGVTSKMVFDKEMGRWVRASKFGRTGSEEDGYIEDETEEDPFKDLESTRGSERTLADLDRRPTPEEPQGPPADDLSRVRDDDENPRSFFESETEDDASETDVTHTEELDEEEQDEDEAAADHEQASQIKASDTLRDSLRSPRASIARLDAPATPSPPSTAVPKSALKAPSASAQSLAGHSTPPIQSSPSTSPKIPRSVSFSDGKTSGKIEGLEPVAKPPPSRLRYEVGSDSEMDTEELGHLPPGGGMPGGLELDEDMFTQDLEQESPSSSIRTKRADEPAGAAPPPRPVESLVPSPPLHAGVPPPPPATRPNPFERTSSGRLFTRATSAEASFFTQCSFGVSHDRLVQFLTDIEPFTARWESLASIALPNKGVESLVRLKEFLPVLEQADLSNNSIAFVTGVAATIRTLLLASNRLTSVTSFEHVRNLNRLDLSHNELGGLQQLSCLQHLRELKADYCSVQRIEGIATIDTLTKLSLKGNNIEAVDFTGTRWSRLEMLNLSRNKIRSVTGLDQLGQLSMINLDHNFAETLLCSRPLPALRILRVSHNNLDRLDASFCPRLRTLFVDANRLTTIHGLSSLRKLENLSVRDQNTDHFTIDVDELRDVRRLYFSGNRLPESLLGATRLYSLVHLELAMTRLEQLPTNFATLYPNLRSLNVSYNYLASLEPLAGLERLRRLDVVGNRLSRCRPLTEVFQAMPDLEILDLRMNPATLPFYAAIVQPATSSDLSKTQHHGYQILHGDDLVSPRRRRIGQPEASLSSAAVTTAPAMSSTSAQAMTPTWQAIDAKFSSSLPDKWRQRRAAFHAVMLQVAPRLAMLDGLARADLERAPVAPPPPPRAQPAPPLATARKQVTDENDWSQSIRLPNVTGLTSAVCSPDEPKTGRRPLSSLF